MAKNGKAAAKAEVRPVRKDSDVKTARGKACGRQVPKTSAAAGSKAPVVKASRKATSEEGRKGPNTPRVHNTVEYKVRRVIKNKLRYIPEAVLNSTRRAMDGKTIFEVLEQELQKKSNAKKRFSVTFWKKIRDQFDWNSELSELLPEFGDDEEVPSDIEDGLDILRADNPAERKPKPLLSALVRVKNFNGKMLYGLAMGLQDGQSLSAKNALKCRVGLLQALGRTIVPSFLANPSPTSPRFDFHVLPFCGRIFYFGGNCCWQNLKKVL